MWFTPKQRIILAHNVELIIRRKTPVSFTIDVLMPQNHYLALSFGGTHINADMIVFVTHSGNEPVAYDMFSTSYGEPVFDDISNLSNFFYDTQTYYPNVQILTDRDFDTGDGEQDFLVEEDRLIQMGFAIRNFEPLQQVNGQVTQFGSHSRHGHFDMIMHSNRIGSTSYWGLYVSGANSLQTLSQSLFVALAATLALC